MVRNFLKIIITSFFFHNSIYAQDKNYWNETVSVDRNDSVSNIRRKLILDEDSLKTALIGAVNIATNKDGVLVSIPNLKGEIEQFQVWENSNFDPELQNKFPDIRSYKGVGVTDKNASISFCLSPLGFKSIVHRVNFIDEIIEYEKKMNTYFLYSSIEYKSNHNTASLECKLFDKIDKTKYNQINVNKTSINDINRTLRLALACNGEYTAHFGGTISGALAAMNETMTAINSIFERDLSLHLNLIANNDVLVFVDSTTDPFSNAVDPYILNFGYELQTTLNNLIGNANYDIGHMLVLGFDMGNAGCIGCVCEDAPAILTSDSNGNIPFKGSGISSSTIPYGYLFDSHLVVHELGHQLGANHTHNYWVDNNEVNVEPGQGTTIMSYGNFKLLDKNNDVDPYFTLASINQIKNNLDTKVCPINVNTTNHSPTVDAGINRIIPRETPFKLIGSGSDVDGDVLLYNWEENDDGIPLSLSELTVFQNILGSYPHLSNTNPNYRSVLPNLSPIRYLPEFSTVLNGRIRSQWECPSSITRTQKFTLTARDQAIPFGQISSDEVSITTDANYGPFALNSYNLYGLYFASGSTQNITWTVNNTNLLPGAALVNIKLSLDNGISFITLVTNTPNDGSELVSFPAVNAQNCRILIEPVDNIFYAINKVPFSIGLEPVITCLDYTITNQIPFDNNVHEESFVVSSNSGTISSISLDFEITHQALGYAYVELTSPSGTNICVMSRRCEENQGTYNLNLSDSGTEIDCNSSLLQNLQSNDALATFYGENPNGVWKIKATSLHPNLYNGFIANSLVHICTQQFSSLSNENQILNELSIYPNPSKGLVNINFNHFVQNVTIEMLDILGQSVLINNNVSGDKTCINTSGLMTGLYMLKIQDGNLITYKKVIIE